MIKGGEPPRHHPDLGRAVPLGVIKDVILINVLI